MCRDVIAEYLAAISTSLPTKLCKLNNLDFSTVLSEMKYCVAMKMFCKREGKKCFLRVAVATFGYVPRLICFCRDVLNLRVDLSPLKTNT
jgi:hypothetical protein